MNNKENGTHSEMVFYGHRGVTSESNYVTPHPLNVVFLTSIRDIGLDDHNGTLVETDNGLQFMEGVIERTVKETHPWWHGSSGITYPGALVDLVRVVGVITDDTEMDLQDSSYSALPVPGRAWIYSSDLRTPDGQLLTDRTFNIPSSFRQLPLRATDERNVLKKEFEQRVMEKTEELGGNIIVSDHYMARIDYLIDGLGFYGRVLNIHPAITLEGHPFCFRGNTPTADALRRAKDGLPTRTGATLHIINSTIDKGPPIAYTVNTPVFSTDKPQWLRYRNYQQSKLPLFVQGLAHYARHIHQHLDILDLDRLEPT